VLLTDTLYLYVITLQDGKHLKKKEVIKYTQDSRSYAFMNYCSIVIKTVH